MHSNKDKPRICLCKISALFILWAFTAIEFLPLYPSGNTAWAEPAGQKDEKQTGEKFYTFDFKKANLGEVLKVFSEMTSKNVVANENIQDLEVTFFLKNIPAAAALKILCKQNDLWYKEDDTHIRLIKTEDFGKDIIVQYEEKSRVFNLKYASALAVADAIDSVMEDRVEYNEPDEMESYGQIGAGDEDVGISGGGGSGGGGGGSGGSGGRGGADVVREVHIPTIAEKLTPKMVENYLQKEPGHEDKRGRIKVEEVSEIKGRGTLAYMTVFIPNNSILVCSSDREIVDEIARIIDALDTPIRQVLLQVKVLEISLGDGFSSLFDIGFQSDKTATRQFPEPQTASRHSGGLGMFGNLDGSTLLYQYFDKELEIRMELLENEGRIQTIATPMVLCANNAPAKFFIGEERPVVTNYEFEVRDFEHRSTETMRPVMSLEEIGTKLEIIPLINENETVTLKLISEFSSLGQGASISQVDLNGNVIVLPIDTIDTSTVEAIIVANNTEAVAIGGLIREEIRDAESRVPVLGNIPLLGFFFKKTERLKEKKEIVMLIVPHIMMKPENIGNVSKKALDRVSDNPAVKENKEKFLQFNKKQNSLELLPEGSIRSF